MRIFQILPRSDWPPATPPLSKTVHGARNGDPGRIRTCNPRSRKLPGIVAFQVAPLAGKHAGANTAKSSAVIVVTALNANRCLCRFADGTSAIALNSNLVINITYEAAA